MPSTLDVVKKPAQKSRGQLYLAHRARYSYTPFSSIMYFSALGYFFLSASNLASNFCCVNWSCTHQKPSIKSYAVQSRKRQGCIIINLTDCSIIPALLLKNDTIYIKLSFSCPLVGYIGHWSLICTLAAVVLFVS